MSDQNCSRYRRVPSLRRRVSFVTTTSTFWVVAVTGTGASTGAGAHAVRRISVKASGMAAAGNVVRKQLADSVGTNRREHVASACSVELNANGDAVGGEEERGPVTDLGDVGG